MLAGRSDLSFVILSCYKLCLRCIRIEKDVKFINHLLLLVLFFSLGYVIIPDRRDRRQLHYSLRTLPTVLVLVLTCP